MAETHRTAQPKKEALADSSQVGASRTTSDSAWGVGLGLDLYIAASIQKQPSCVDNTGGDKGDDDGQTCHLLDSCFNEVRLRSCVVFLNMKSWKTKVSRTNRSFSLLQPYM